MDLHEEKQDYTERHDLMYFLRGSVYVYSLENTICKVLLFIFI